MKKILSTIPLVVLVLSVSSIGFAATHYVPDDFSTIQAALDGAVAGDEIIVRDGVYRGAGNKDLDFGGKALTLRSENGADRCFIDCERSGRGFNFHSGETVDSVLDGFAITNGHTTDGPWPDGHGGGIFCEFSSPTISNCVIASNSAERGGGMYCESASPTITNCSIATNTASHSGGGIFCSSSSPTITNCSFTGNWASAPGGGIYCVDASSPAVTGCFIATNTATVGAGIFCESSSPTLTNCTVLGNHASAFGGGIECSLSSSAVIVNSFITANTADSYGGGIFCDSSSLTIMNCSVRANTAGFGGGGLYCSSSSPAITSCSITANTAGVSGGGIFCEFSSPTITNCILWNDFPNEIYELSGSASVTYSDVSGGYAGAGNIEANPQFSSDSYHLTAGSPCIDTGTDAGVYDDIDGDVRPMGAGCDMGCDEYVLAPVISYYPPSFTTSCFQGSDPLPQGLVVWNSGGGTLSYSVSDDAGWLDCTPSRGASAGETDSITVNYDASGLAPGTYAATITISDASASNDPQYVSVKLTVLSYQLSAITLVAPANESVLNSPPTFSWGADGGTNNVFAADLSLSYPITGYWSTYENLGLQITDQSWVLSESVWNSIPSGSFVYWRVRGADLDYSPLTIITSGKVWWFYKR